MSKCSIKKLFSQENTCVGVFPLMKMQAFSPATLLKRLRQRCFPVNIAKFLIKPILKDICERLFERFPT